ncbi:MAG TPA: DUF2268 domain-containing putative Zn-dependent protease [Candidatus Dormibacteraeota bacterium]|nr:DUF2268 domain-containing putative Zn-dependent protease [Candidatus Dormibacteraeota bacterium]
MGLPCWSAGGRPAGFFRTTSPVMLKVGALGVVAALALTGCAGVSPMVPVRFQTAGGRFEVSLSRGVVKEFARHQFALRRLTEEDLARIGKLLPGPATTIAVTVGDPDQILSQIGATGFTDPETGAITIGLFRYWAQEPPDVIRELARTLAREVNGSVRVTLGVGLGKTLLGRLVTYGIATAFDQSAFPGPPDPWVDELSAKQECRQWRHLEPLLTTVGTHGQVLVVRSANSAIPGKFSLPQLPDLAIGYRIVADYLARTQGVSWATLVDTPAQTIFRASGYAPCPAG